MNADLIDNHVFALLRSTRPARVDHRISTTVLFVDIVESTRRAVELGDSQWLDLLGAHENMLRRELRRFGGRCLQTLGDGLVAVFGSAIEAVHCATRITDASRAFGLEVRVGLHSGECLRRGRRLGGLVFHIGARVVNRAGAGEVLVSRPVKESATGDGMRFVQRGRYRLKGLPGQWPLFAAAAVRLGIGGAPVP